MLFVFHKLILTANITHVFEGGEENKYTYSFDIENWYHSFSDLGFNIRHSL